MAYSVEEGAAVTLDRMADYIEQHGWTRGELEDAKGRVCVLGAFRAVGRTDRRKYRTRYADRAANAIRDEIPWPIGISGWNDLYAKDKRQVVRMLRRAARKLRGASR